MSARSWGERRGRRRGARQNPLGHTTPRPRAGRTQAGPSGPLRPERPPVPGARAAPQIGTGLQPRFCPGWALPAWGGGSWGRPDLTRTPQQQPLPPGDLCPRLPAQGHPQSQARATAVGGPGPPDLTPVLHCRGSGGCCCEGAKPRDGLCSAGSAVSSEASCRGPGARRKAALRGALHGQAGTHKPPGLGSQGRGPERGGSPRKAGFWRRPTPAFTTDVPQARPLHPYRLISLATK